MKKVKRNSKYYQIVLFILLSRIILVIVGVIAFTTFTFSSNSYKYNFHYPENESKYVLPFKTWDAQHYLFIAKKGYSPNNESNRFFPLYPFLINTVSRMGIPLLVSAYGLSMIFSLGSAVVLYKLVMRLFDNAQTATYSVVALFIYPVSFFLSLPYTESIFLFISILFFYFLETKKLPLAFLMSLLLPLTRPTGVFIILPLFLYILRMKKKSYGLSIPTFNKPLLFSLSPIYLCIGFPVIGVMLYFLIMNYYLGSPFSGISGLNSISSWNLFGVIDPLSVAKNLFLTKVSLHGFNDSIIDRLFFIFFMVMLPLVYKKMPRHYFFYTLVVGLVPLFGSFTSYTRYLLPAFPIFIVLAILLQGKNKEYFRVILIFSCALMQSLFFIMHILNYWVA